MVMGSQVSGRELSMALGTICSLTRLLERFADGGADAGLLEGGRFCAHCQVAFWDRGIGAQGAQPACEASVSSLRSCPPAAQQLPTAHGCAPSAPVQVVQGLVGKAGGSEVLAAGIAEVDPWQLQDPWAGARPKRRFQRELVPSARPRRQRGGASKRNAGQAGSVHAQQAAAAGASRWTMPERDRVGRSAWEVAEERRALAAEVWEAQLAARQQLAEQEATAEKAAIRLQAAARRLLARGVLAARREERQGFVAAPAHPPAEQVAPSRQQRRRLRRQVAAAANAQEELCLEQALEQERRGFQLHGRWRQLGLQEPYLH